MLLLVHKLADYFWHYKGNAASSQILLANGRESTVNRSLDGNIYPS